MLPLLAVSAAVVGALLGAVSRVLLGRLRRGTVVRPGPLEAASALITAVGLTLSWPSGPWLMVCWIGVLAVPLSAVDVAHHRLPDAMTLPAIPLTLVVAGVSDLVGAGPGSVIRSAVAGLVVGGLFLALAILVPAAMGRGDAKLAFSIGAALGYLSWPAVLLGVFLAFAIGSVVGLAGVVTRRFGLRSAMAFGPALLAGCWLVLAVPGLLGWFSVGTAAVSAASGAP